MAWMTKEVISTESQITDNTELGVALVAGESMAHEVCELSEVGRWVIFRRWFFLKVFFVTVLAFLGSLPLYIFYFVILDSKQCSNGRNIRGICNICLT